MVALLKMRAQKNMTRRSEERRVGKDDKKFLKDKKGCDDRPCDDRPKERT